MLIDLVTEGDELSIVCQAVGVFLLLPLDLDEVQFEIESHLLL
jgi:hypothetical protein